MRHLSLMMIALSLSLFGSFARPNAADACSYPPDSITVRDTPINGVVILDVVCVFGSCFEGELPTQLPVMDKTSGEMVDGEIVHSIGTLNGNALIAWRRLLYRGHSGSPRRRPHRCLHWRRHRARWHRARSRWCSRRARLRPSRPHRAHAPPRSWSRRDTPRTRSTLPRPAAPATVSSRRV